MTEHDLKPESTVPEGESSLEGRMEAKRRSDRLSSITWALILIWVGLVFMAVNLGWLEPSRTSIVHPWVSTLAGMGVWSAIFLGAGGLVFIEALIRTFAKPYRSTDGGNFFLAAIFLGVGLSAIFGWRVVWPLVLIAMGLFALLSALIRR